MRAVSLPNVGLCFCTHACVGQIVQILEAPEKKESKKKNVLRHALSIAVASAAVHGPGY